MPKRDRPVEVVKVLFALGRREDDLEAYDKALKIFEETKSSYDEVAREILAKLKAEFESE